MGTSKAYQTLANRLDSFPQGFPATKSGVELDLLAYLFTPDEAALAAYLSLVFTPLDLITDEAGYSKTESRALVKSMVSKGLISIRRGDKGLEGMLLPFIVGFYENQRDRMDETFAQLFEDYYAEAMEPLLSIKPQFHRVIPINESVNSKIEILPEDNIIALLSSKQAWAVIDCVCRIQKSLLGEGCDHPVKVCLVMSDQAGVFENQSGIEALDFEGALAVLDQAAAAGLVHTVSNQKSDITYVCNCCTCSCGILRGIADAKMANVVARSAYVALIDDRVCIGCGICEEMCQFGAITVTDVAEITAQVCVGCGVCTRVCPEAAITLTLRPSEEILNIPDSVGDWLAQRQSARRNI